jgi:hypothetical protein
VCLSIPLALAIGCGGVTDIDFQGDEEDAGTTGGAAGSGGIIATGGFGAVDGGSGGAVVGGSGGIPSGGAPAGGSGGSSGTGVVCGGQVCEPPSAPIPVDSCCVGDKCGLSSDLIGGQCIELGQPGTVGGGCPDQNFQGFPLEGCCKPNGNCGVMDTFLGLGCVDPSEFGGPPGQKCVDLDAGTGGTGGGPTDGGTGGAPADAGTPGATNCGVTNPTVCTPAQNCCVLDPGQDYCSAKTTPCACTGPNCDITPVSCDGPEDCPGQICCGTFSPVQNQYTDLSCKATCSGATEREICHPNSQTCSNPNQSCSPSQFLPSYIWRCN